MDKTGITTIVSEDEDYDKHMLKDYGLPKIHSTSLSNSVQSCNYPSN